MVDCSQKVAAVLGGAGNIGSGVVAGFLKRGYGRVAAISRDAAKLEKLKNQLGAEASRVAFIVGDVSSESGAEAARNEALQQCGGRIDDVVCAIGFPWWQKGPVMQQSRAELENSLNTAVIVPFIVYKTFVVAVKDNQMGSYTFVTGGGADMFLGPGTGFMSVCGAAAQGLARVSSKEHMGDAASVAEVSFQVGVSPVPDQMPPGFTWIHNQDAGDAVVSVAVNRQARGKTVLIANVEALKQAIEKGI